MGGGGKVGVGDRNSRDQAGFFFFSPSYFNTR